MAQVTVPANHMGALGEFLALSVGPSPNSVVVGIWGANQQMEALALSSLPINIFLKENQFEAFVWVNLQLFHHVPPIHVCFSARATCPNYCNCILHCKIS